MKTFRKLSSKFKLHELLYRKEEWKIFIKNFFFNFLTIHSDDAFKLERERICRPPWTAVNLTLNPLMPLKKFSTLKQNECRLKVSNDDDFHSLFAFISSSIREERKNMLQSLIETYDGNFHSVFFYFVGCTPEIKRRNCILLEGGRRLRSTRYEGEEILI